MIQGGLEMLRETNPIYTNICPYCSREASAREIEEYGSCSECVTGMERNNTLILHKLNKMEEEEFRRFFKETTGCEIWGLQKNWIKRLLSGENVVLIAPTGMGKTTLLLTYSLYQALKYGWKTIYIAPTTSLLQQVYDKLRELNSRVNGRARIVIYHSKLPSKTKLEIQENVLKGNYDILLVTSNYVLRKLPREAYEKTNLVIIDDVDSMLKTNRSVEKTLNLIGYDREIIDMVREKMKLIWRILVAKTLDNREEYIENTMRILEIEKRINNMLSNRKRRQVAIASATGRVRGEYGAVLRELLKTDISNITLYCRNVTDTYAYMEKLDDVIDKIVEIGSGGLILVSSKHPFREELEEKLEVVKKKLIERNLVVEEAEPRTINQLLMGKVDVITGSANYYGLCVRGIDSPKHIKYIVFLGTPIHSIRINNYLASVKNMLRTLIMLKEEGYGEFREELGEIRKTILKLTPGEAKLLNSLLRGKIDPESISNGRLRETYYRISECYNKLLETLKKIVNEKKVLEMGTVTFIERNGDVYALIPDTYTYIQATGRTSRLMNRSFTHGLSIILEYEKLRNLVSSLERRLSLISGETTIRDIETIDMGLEKKLIEESRRGVGEELKYRSILVVVESPTKARTIAGFFGKPIRRRIGNLNVYEAFHYRDGEIIHLNLVATRGHLYDLTTNPNTQYYGINIHGNTVQPIYETIKKCRVCGYQFTHGSSCTRCGSVFIKDSIEVINVLRKLSSEVDEVYIATDPDIEGEKIAYDVYLSIKGVNSRVYRAKLHEITMREFLNAIESRETINENLVVAEIYRRILDRLIGFSLSKKLQYEFNDRNMGAGRVQTPVLKWIIERAREYSNNRVILAIYRLEKHPDITYRHTIPLGSGGEELFDNMEAVFKLRRRQVITIKPKPPYTTDQLLHDASKLGYNVSTIMRIAQELFESGLITYHRTNNTYVSNTGLTIAEKYLENKGLKTYYKPNHWGEKGGHEAIRPVYPLDRDDLEKAINEGLINTPIPLTKNHYRIYSLIFNRFITSQMKPYRIVQQEYDIYVDNKHVGVLVIDTNIVENGFNIIEKKKIVRELDNVTEFRDKLKLVFKIKTSLKPLYREGDIVHRMRIECIGRPSTYSKIIESIIRHGYVIRSRRRNYLVPTSKGLKTLDYLERNYSDLISVEITRRLENSIDKLANGEESIYNLVLNTIDLLNRYNLVTETPVTASIVSQHL
ncbi:MAG: reverse gyrase [Desulfurococcaceae archaeon]